MILPQDKISEFINFIILSINQVYLEFTHRIISNNSFYF